jgi:hypothetical protein
VAAADHKLETVEQQHLYEMLEELSDRQIPHEVMEDFFDLWSEGLVRQGFDATVRGLAGEIPSHNFRRLAYVAAVGVAYADRVLQDEELRILSAIADAFEIPPPEAVRLREQVAGMMA